MSFFQSTAHLMAFIIQYFSFMINETDRGLPIEDNIKTSLQTNKKMYRNLGKLISKVIILCFSSFYFGYCLTYLSTINSQIMTEYFGLGQSQNETMGVLIGVMVVGAGVGALFARVLMKFFSRKKFVLLINCGALFICGIININNIYLLLVSRIFQGIFVGNYMAITPIYINELTPLSIRGQFGAFTQIFVIVGIVVSYSLGVIFYATSANYQLVWRFMFTFPALTIITQSILLMVDFVPESPVSLLAAGKEEQARKLFAQFNEPEAIQAAMIEAYESLGEQMQKEGMIQLSENKQNDRDSRLPSNIRRSVQEAESIHVKSNIGKTQLKYFKKQLVQVAQQNKQIPWKALFLGFQLPFMQQMSGVNMIVTQIGAITSAYDPNLAVYTPLIANIIQLIATLFSMPALTKFGRRPLILTGNLTLGIFDLVMGIMFLINSINGQISFIYVSLAFILLFMISYGVTIGPIVWLYVPEVIPAKYVPIATSMNWLGASICIIASPYIIKAVGSPYPVFFGFAAITLFFFCFNAPILVESKGRIRKQILQELR